MLLEAGVHPLRPEAGRGIHVARVHGRAGVTTVERLLAREGAAPIAERTLVVAIGSNASPEVIAGKYANAASGCHWATPFLTGVLHGVGVGYSAHVTPRGYIPAAPHASPHAVTPVVAAWFDDAQLDVVDATERNYDRVELDARWHPLVLDSGSARGRTRPTSRDTASSAPPNHPVRSRSTRSRRSMTISRMRRVTGRSRASPPTSATSSRSPTGRRARPRRCTPAPSSPMAWRSGGGPAASRRPPTRAAGTRTTR
ncbi:hypothetical protein [Agromyces mangrovi Wang et al. 2018]|uniref:hypothetical protein n=1 Tax=Agromyces mangrovi TaxID=1858653 RepID=UPI0025734DCB|nr:hypothetical protein [Agromyces mangrovi]